MCGRHRAEAPHCTARLRQGGGNVPMAADSTQGGDTVSPPGSLPGRPSFIFAVVQAHAALSRARAISFPFSRISSFLVSLCLSARGSGEQCECRASSSLDLCRSASLANVGIVFWQRWFAAILLADLCPASDPKHRDVMSDCGAGAERISVCIAKSTQLVVPRRWMGFMACSGSSAACGGRRSTGKTHRPDSSARLVHVRQGMRSAGLPSGARDLLRGARCWPRALHSCMGEPAGPKPLMRARWCVCVRVCVDNCVHVRLALPALRGRAGTLERVRCAWPGVMRGFTPATFAMAMWGQGAVAAPHGELHSVVARRRGPAGGRRRGSRQLRRGGLPGQAPAAVEKGPPLSQRSAGGRILLEAGWAPAWGIRRLCSSAWPPFRAAACCRGSDASKRESGARPRLPI